MSNTRNTPCQPCPPPMTPKPVALSFPFSSNFCFFLAGLVEEDEDALEEESSEVDDDDRWLLLTGVAIRT